MINKALNWLADKSFYITKALFYGLLLVSAFYRFINPIPPFLLYMFIFSAGLYVGYSAAYYSIKYLQNREE